MFTRIMIVVFSIGLAGCAATQSQSPVAQLQVRVAELEQQLDVKNDEIQNLNQEVKGLSSEVERLESRQREQASFKKTASQGSGSARPSGDIKDIIRVPATPEEVQKALKNAGHYDGAIDGKVGVRTQKAIGEFQRSCGLKVDGIVGAKTWSELKTHLE